jgi:hypothetical protein
MIVRVMPLPLWIYDEFLNLQIDKFIIYAQREYNDGYADSWSEEIVPRLFFDHKSGLAIEVQKNHPQLYKSIERWISNVYCIELGINCGIRVTYDLIAKQCIFERWQIQPVEIEPALSQVLSFTVDDEGEL